MLYVLSINHFYTTLTENVEVRPRLFFMIAKCIFLIGLLPSLPEGTITTKKTLLRTCERRAHSFYADFITNVYAYSPKDAEISFFRKVT